MDQLEKYKNEVARERLSLKEIKGAMGRLDLKREEISEKLAEISTALKTATDEQKTAIARYARDEITEDCLDGLHEKISSLQGKEKAFRAALEVIDEDLVVAKEKEKVCADLLKRFEEITWKIIADNEINNASAILRRAYAAAGRARDKFELNRMEFLNAHVFSPLFNQVNDAACQRDLEEMTREYLK